MCPLKLDLLSVTFDPETAEINLLILTHSTAAITLQHHSCDMSTRSLLIIYRLKIKAAVWLQQRYYMSIPVYWEG